MELPCVPSLHLPSLDWLLCPAKFIQDFYYSSLLLTDSVATPIFAWMGPWAEVLLAWFVDLVQNMQEQSSLDVLHALILPH